MSRREAFPRRLPLLLPALGGLVLVVSASTAPAGRSDALNPSVLAPGLVQANEAVIRLERLADEANAIGHALFRVQNDLAEKRAAATAPPDCKTPWLLDLGARSRELGRAFRDAVQSARVQSRRVEDITVEPTVRPLLDAETSHSVLTLLTRVEDLERRYPEAAAWQGHYLDPMLHGCEPVLAPAAGIADAAPDASDDAGMPTVLGMPRRPPLLAILAVGGGFLCPGAVPAAGVMLVTGKICYSASETCDCEPEAISPATVLGPVTKAGSAN